MLAPDELRDVARLKRLTPANAERDYIMELFLFGLYSEVGPELVFKGGTCLYKLHKLNRFSEDLDFTLNKRIDIEETVQEVLRRLKLLGVSASVRGVKEYPKEVNFRLLFRGPLFRGGRESLCFIPINISLRERVILGPERLALASMYREIPRFDVFSMRAEEILAEKVRAIFTRNKPRDLYDLWFLFGSGTRLDLKLVNRKLVPYRVRFGTEKIAERINEMAKLWVVDLKNLIIGKLPGLEEVKSGVIGHVERSLSNGS